MGTTQSSPEQLRAQSMIEKYKAEQSKHWTMGLLYASVAIGVTVMSIQIGKLMQLSYTNNKPQQQQPKNSTSTFSFFQKEASNPPTD